MEEGTITGRIRDFLAEQFPRTKNLKDEQPLLGGGVIDSLGILEVVTFLENEFKITVADEELLPANFGSVRDLAEFVRKKQNGSCSQ
ncbi:MAG TPA: acyl carrier protein [Candidatus Binatia bacterium]